MARLPKGAGSITLRGSAAHEFFAGLVERPKVPAQTNDIEREAELLRNLADAMRYRRLRILGCAVMDTPQLAGGFVSRFTNLDEIVDADLRAHPERGE